MVEQVHNIVKEYIENPLSLIGDFTYDEYVDWLELGDKSDLEAALKVFEEKEVPEDYITVLKLKLKEWE